MAGLLDAHRVTGNEQALEILTGIGDWAHERLAPLPPDQLERMWDIYIAGEYGGVNESLATLHGLTGTEEYLVAAGRFDNSAVMDPVALGEDVLDGRHANQHIPQFTGYLRIYEGSDEAEYYTAAKNFWDMVVPHRIYSHGGMGVGEMFRTRDVIVESLYDDRNHAETCPLYNMLKLSRNLFFHEPDPKYMNYYERGLLNQIAGSRRDVDSVDGPEVTYFVPVQPGSRRRYGNTGTCCGGTGMENHTKYQDSIYFRSADDSALYVNLYVASTLEMGRARPHGHTVHRVPDGRVQRIDRGRQRAAGRPAPRARVGQEGLHGAPQRRAPRSRRRSGHVRFAGPHMEPRRQDRDRHALQLPDRTGDRPTGRPVDLLRADLDGGPWRPGRGRPRLRSRGDELL